LSLLALAPAYAEDTSKTIDTLPEAHSPQPLSQQGPQQGPLQTPQQETPPLAGEANLFDAPADPVVDSQNVKAYRSTVADIERSEGAYAQALVEPLLSLALSLQQQDRHEEAIDIVKRGAHLSRINLGLYTGDQIPLLRTQIESHLALGQYEEADERQRYLYRVERRALDGQPEAIDALMRQADWQRQAYTLEVGEEETLGGRLLLMWDLYRVALIESIKQKGNYDPSLLTPLYGMLQAQYLIAGHQSYNGSDFITNAEARFSAYNSIAFKRGSKVLKAIEELNLIHYPDTPQKHAEDLIQQGDWYWWFGKWSDAETLYRQAAEVLLPPMDDTMQEGGTEATPSSQTGSLASLAELDTETDASVALATDSTEATLPASDDTGTLTTVMDKEEREILLQTIMAKLFAAPVPIPNVDGIHPLPPYRMDESEELVFRFTVTDTGRVIDLERLREPDVQDDDARKRIGRLARSLKQTRFRPRFANNEPATTEQVTLSFARHHWMPPVAAMAGR
jgi:hypothetical protein